ncbi:MAG: NAD(P)H-hydrate epimerase [Thermoguttaceae bacterium]|nr:NAD(P)H-hydrate epimerase [Thermoguttaceae bacterium]
MKTATCREVRELDARAVVEWKIPSLLLMENAGRGLAEIFLANAARLNGGVSPRRVLICCGKGNNGGDGFVLFRRLELLGVDCRIVAVGTPESYRGDALTNLEIVRAATSQNPEKISFFDGSSQAFERLEVELTQADWAVDALLGTGATGALRAPFDGIVEALNRSGKPVYAVDIPSGLNADDGTVATDAVRAKLTTTLAVAKPGLWVDAAKVYVGELYVADIGVPVEPFLRWDEQ